MSATDGLAQVVFAIDVGPTGPGAGVSFFELSAGERTVPGIWHENYWQRRHEVAYGWVAELVDRLSAGLARAPRLLDAGCGEGYGPAMLAQRPAAVLALDYDSPTVAHLASHYPRLPVAQGNLVALPVRERAFDVVVSLQTIEHVWDQARFVAECHRVLRPGGRLVLSTPNRHTFPPGNPFHHRELAADELEALLAPWFGDVQLYGLHHGERLRQWEDSHGSIVEAQICAPVDRWPPELAAEVADVTVGDFVIDGRTQACLDLLAIGRAA